ncbi:MULTISPECIES: PPOX class F420-dependent oxidoreductase [Streptomyces]|uniref:PPOX class F420-dependent oxidoreductase n=2 Tax=Streptomyces TaxID=1883 RepID=A0A6G3SRR2_STRAQ|nr:PPOX class F420-dependent oxidoreductase [Streptomyces sp. CS057]NDZ62409.1 PPOX class F420-dependent oxidoreductase [Streptomyces anulatus]NEB85589.1 PPOX class F420-dependent oxidoreductase [Streptomyces anulatus]NEE07635.1 PPOX class F420-dependent oxidoreductase [Streptomyces sp. SID7499]OWA25765.1 PPOX class F420-dependent enzyme [Streptomyces sp. CS057]
MTLQDFARSEYVSLTTYRKNGTPVATPVWAAAEGDVLYVWTRSDSWKVKRLRNNGKVVVTVCDVRGRIAEGASSAEGAATLLDEDGTRAVRKLLARKYTWKFWLVDWPATVARLGKRPHTGIAITF